jgi:hypothetical protein
MAPSAAAAAAGRGERSRHSRSKSKKGVRPPPSPPPLASPVVAGARRWSDATVLPLRDASTASVAGAAARLSSLHQALWDDRDDRSWEDLGKVAIRHDLPPSSAYRPPRSLWAAWRRPFADLDGGADVPWHQVGPVTQHARGAPRYALTRAVVVQLFPWSVEQVYRGRMAPSWRRELDVILLLWLAAVVLSEVFNETRPFSGLAASAVVVSPVGLRWTFISQVPVSACMLSRAAASMSVSLTHTHTLTNSFTCTHTHTYTQHIHIPHTHSLAHTYTHIQMYTHTHSHTLSPCLWVRRRWWWWRCCWA